MKLRNWSKEIKSSENKIVLIVFWLNKFISFDAIVYPSIRNWFEQIFFSLKLLNNNLVVWRIFKR
jgi:hypothetical protein